MMEKQNLRIGILTTNTLHHVRFVQQLKLRWNIVRVFEEDRQPSATFEIHHPFEDERERYEQECWFDGKPASLRDVAEVSRFCDLNEPAAIEAMRAADCNVLVVFGTGRLDADVVRLAEDRIVTLHGADPEHYRGLDTHLWAIYHRDFRNLVTTLHKVGIGKDRGGVVMKKPLPIERGMQLYQMRKVNTEVCIDITNAGLEMMANYGQFISQPQLYIGRHYSFMPAVLKDRCVQNFAAFTATL